MTLQFISSTGNTFERRYENQGRGDLFLLTNRKNGGGGKCIFIRQSELIVWLDSDWCFKRQRLVVANYELLTDCMAEQSYLRNAMSCIFVLIQNLKPSNFDIYIIIITLNK